MDLQNVRRLKVKNKYNIELHLDFTRARILLGRINTVNELMAVWKIAGPCIEKCPSIEKIQTRKNIS